ncbi:hypothetical protein NADFUDRAFT_47890 [Nadsonia fulvescens var. elongata DSM 6958]|uniref:Small ribosomal subunit protein mS38 n=1 Tax=Nadsonia fulvescens var. elongata DSM 6958 TaxID=857566 RepID=A0A1E3PDY4_9ASCO|nr:hypothetical protein NADFUDRAFT_47890 [Nadsonia fulvescens var. elongata DSM 6958]
MFSMVRAPTMMSCSRLISRSVHTARRKYIDCSQLSTPDISHLHPQEIFYSGFVYGNNPIVPDYVEKALPYQSELEMDLPMRHTSVLAYKPEIPSHLLEASFTAYQPPPRPSGTNCLATRDLIFGKPYAIPASTSVQKYTNVQRTVHRQVNLNQKVESNDEMGIAFKDLTETIQQLQGILSSSKVKIEEITTEEGSILLNNRTNSAGDYFEIVEPATPQNMAGLELTSVKRKRKLKMNKHKHRKRRKAQKALRRKLGH